LSFIFDPFHHHPLFAFGGANAFLVIFYPFLNGVVLASQ